MLDTIHAAALTGFILMISVFVSFAILLSGMPIWILMVILVVFGTLVGAGIALVWVSFKCLDVVENTP